MLYTPTSLKFLITIQAEGFSMETDPWAVSVRNDFGKVQASFQRDDCPADSQGNRYILLPDLPTGLYHAVTTVQVPDLDFPDGHATLTDRQHLCAIGTRSCQPHTPTPVPHPSRPSGEPPLTVTFTPAFAPNLTDDGTTHLVDADGNPIADADGTTIAVPATGNKTYQLPVTGEELEKLLVGGKDNGTTDSLQEVINATADIPEGKTIKETIQEEEEERLATDDDIHALFN